MRKIFILFLIIEYLNNSVSIKIYNNLNYEMKKIILTVIICLIPLISQAKSLNTYIKEADSGNSSSALKLGLMYEFGLKNKIDKDINKAIYYYSIAAEEDNYRAISRLGVISYNRAEYNKAIDYFKMGAKNGESLSEAYLGKIIEERSEDKTKAVKFYESSIKKNNPYGKIFLGEHLIKTKERGSREFIRGYALLVSASKVNEQAKVIIKRHPYTFSKSDQIILKEEFDKIK